MQKNKRNAKQSKLIKIARTMLFACGLATGGLLTILGGMMASYHLGKAMQHRATENSKRYVESHLEEAMKKQEEVLGIKHIGKPTIVYGCHPYHDGVYKSYVDTISLEICRAITPEKNISDILAKHLAQREPFDVKSVLDHELGHFYMDKLNESKGNGDYVLFEGDQDWKGKNLIAEGIATYFERSLNKWEDPVAKIKESDIKAVEKMLKLYNVYEVGYRVVKPIIDGHGTKAIEYLIENPPNINGKIDDQGRLLDLTVINELKAYQTKVLEQLSGKE